MLGRVPRADDRARHVEARVVGQLGPLAQCGARIGNSPPPEGLELLSAPWLSVFPGIALVITVLGTNLLADGLQANWDRPRA